jgi:hypothetical protein
VTYVGLPLAFTTAKLNNNNNNNNYRTAATQYTLGT